MPWMMLTSRQREAVLESTLTDDDARENADVLRMIRRKLQHDGELHLTDLELNRVVTASRRWTGGFERAMKAVLAAAEAGMP